MDDLRKEIPGRGKIDRTNVVFEDIVASLVACVAHLARFEAMGESRFGMILNRELDKLIEMIKLFKRRINDERSKMNAVDIDD